jgi:imidazolonepropionase
MVFLYPGPESNRHSRKNRILSPARLPVPPPGHITVWDGKYRIFLHICNNFRILFYFFSEIVFLHYLRGMARVLIKNIKTLFQVGEEFPSFLKGKEMDRLTQINDAFLALEDNEIIAYGEMKDWEGILDWRNLEVIDAEGKFVFPGFCDPHTHLVFATTREEEFEDRIKGLSYEDIAAKGGGILNSARKLNDLSEDELFSSALNRLHLIKSYGTTAVEIKSGYGLNVESELKMLRVIKRLKAENIMEVKATFLGAHAFPAEFKENHEGYIRLIIDEMLPRIAEEKLADYIDVFCERNYFSVSEMEEILKAGKNHGLIPKVHVNQFSILGGVKAAVDLGALSVDHLEEFDEQDLNALKNSGCMPTLLPGCSHFISIPFAPGRYMIDNGLPVALASDFNPGSTPNGNLFQVLSLACIKMKLTPNEAINSLTINAAYAMGLEKTHGTISVGKRPGIIITKEVSSLAFLPYAFGDQHIDRVL